MVLKLIQEIKELARQIGREINLMEVCGTHTQAISRFGLRSLMPENIRLITGPGCPVCVTPQKDIDAVVNLALAGVPVASYGDALRVPGRFGSLDKAREKGAKVFSVYSIEEVLPLKEKYPDLVFLGIGFETTAPMTAWGVKQGLTVYSAHKVFPPAMAALLEDQEVKVDGFIAPGHVSAIIGTEPYKKIKAPQVISGFEANDILESIYMLLLQIKEGRQEVENQYKRLVKKEGNREAQKLIAEVFEIQEGSWRGLGDIPGSGLEIRKEFQEQDAKVKYKDIFRKIDFSRSIDPPGCRCGDVLRGVILPRQCPLFGKVCQPDNPVGACMVSVEGACHNFWRYQK